MDKIGPTNNFSKEFFLKEFHGFRAIMCSAIYNVEQKLDAFKGLFYVYVSLDSEMSEDDRELCESAMSMLNSEFNMRLSIQETMQITALFEEHGISI